MHGSSWSLSDFVEEGEEPPPPADRVLSPKEDKGLPRWVKKQMALIEMTRERDRRRREARELREG